MQSCETSIGHFEAYFRDELELIRESAGDPNDGSVPAGRRRAHSRTLVVTLLDGLAGLRFSKATHPELSAKNQERFTRFVADFCDWPEGQLVSGPVLYSRLVDAKNDGALKLHLETILSRFDTDRGNSLPLAEFDRSVGELLALATNEREEKLVLRSQQIILLYRYRNFLVHEFRSPGYGMGSMCTDQNKPCYHGVLGEQQWRLAYPTEFFLRLSYSAVARFVEYLRDNSIDPYKLVSDSSAW